MVPQLLEEDSQDDEIASNLEIKQPQFVTMIRSNSWKAVIDTNRGHEDHFATSQLGGGGNGQGEGSPHSESNASFLFNDLDST